MLHQHADLDHRWFDTHPLALIDAVWRDDLPQAWGAQPLTPRFLGSDTGRCPVLLDLRRLGPGEASWLIDTLEAQTKGREATICSLLLQTTASTQSVLRHLSDRIALAWPGRATPRQFRFFDPGTLVQLPRLLGEPGMAWLLGPISSVLAPWAGHWAEYRPSALPSQRFCWDEAHRRALSNLGSVNRVAMSLAPPEDVLQWLARCERAERHVVRAQREHGLARQADLVAFACHAMTQHPAFDAHAEIAALLARLRQAAPEDELDYRELTAALSPEDWARVRADLGEPMHESPSP